MKRQLITVIGSFVILGALILAYVLIRKPVSDSPAQTGNTQESIVLIEKTKDDIEKVVFENENGTFTILPNTKTDENDSQDWVLAEYPELMLNNYNISSMVSPMYYLSPAEMLIPETDNPAEYGFDSPAAAKATYKDKSTETVYIGNKTPTGDYYYMMREGDPAVYLMIKITGARFFNGFNEIIDKSIPQIDLNSMVYAYINEKDKVEIEIDYAGDKSNMQEEIQNSGIALEMKKPYDDREVYASYFTSHISGSFNSYSLGDIVEIDCQDLSKYGLSDPELTIILEDPAQRLHLCVGDYAPDDNEKASVPEYAYVRLGDSNNVFLMRSSYFNSFRGMNPIKFVDRFVILPNIETVDAVKIESREHGRAHDIIINHETTKSSDGRDIDNIFPSIDGTEIEEEPFRNFYRALIGLVIDLEIEGYTITEEPLATITYSFNTGEEDVVTRYYPYNDNFYAVQKNDEPIRFAVNKQAMKIVFDNMDSLFAE